MADETRNAVELLDQDNHGAWCMRMEFLLESKGLDGCIDGTASVQGSEKDRKARALIGLHVKEHHLATVNQTAELPGCHLMFAPREEGVVPEGLCHD
jgi:hypothetical protein